MDPLSQNISGHYAPEKKTILSLCSNRQGYSIADFARLLDASIPKVTRIVTEMVADGYLVDLGKTGSSGGRRASIFGLNPKAGYFVGVHVEQERITVAATDFPGQLVHAVESIPLHLEKTEESVHEMCLAVDILDSASSDAASSAVASWLRENAWQYGFILRYPEGSEESTGMPSNPWHYRFVGEAAAAQIQQLGITLEDYVNMFYNDSAAVVFER